MARLSVVLSAALAGWAASSVCPAQTMNTGAFLGTIRDPSGATVPGARVRVERLDPPLVREVLSDSRGEYLAREVPPGEYRIVISARGFETTIRAGLAISPGQTIRVDQTLRVGAVSDTVTVSERVTTVETSSPNVGSNVYADQVQELALSTRSFTQLLQLMPGVASNQDQEQGFGSNTSINVSFNGAPQNANNITLDGTRNLDPYNGNNPTMVNLDAIAEVRVERNAYSSEYGRNSGAQVNVVTKGGSNGFHGSAFEFFRNDKLNARNFFSISRPKNRYNNFGWTLGGPVRRNKLFFFLSNEYRRIWQNTGVRTGQVLTDTEIAGPVAGVELLSPPHPGLLPRQPELHVQRARRHPVSFRAGTARLQPARPPDALRPLQPRQHYAHQPLRPVRVRQLVPRRGRLGAVPHPQNHQRHGELDRHHQHRQHADHRAVPPKYDHFHGTHGGAGARAADRHPARVLDRDGFLGVHPLHRHFGDGRHHPQLAPEYLGLYV